MSTKVFCPICGAEVIIPEHQHTVDSAVVIGKDSNLGAIPLNVVAPGKPTKAEERIEALKRAGVDTSSLFALKGAAGDGFVVRMTDGCPSIVPDDDPVFTALMEGDTIPERRLFRRWVMGQMFHMLASPFGYTNQLKTLGYEYQWKMMVDEFKTQARLAVNDQENFEMRNLWFNKDVAIASATDYIDSLRKYTKRLRLRKYHGEPYMVLTNRYVMVKDLDTDIFLPLHKALDAIMVAESADELYQAVVKFNRCRVKMPHITKMCDEWVDAYKGSGAYYTLHNLILFHGARIHENDGRVRSKSGSIRFIADKAKSETCGWKMLGLLKQTIEDNGIDIAAKRAEWRR